MRIRFHPGSTAAFLLAAVAVACGWVGARLQWDGLARHDSPAPQLGPAARAALERCLEQVTTVHDVYWAAACMQFAEAAAARRAVCQGSVVDGPAAASSVPCDSAPPDDAPDCTLPMERAGPLNAARGAADQRCMVEAAEAQRVAGRPAGN